MSEEVVINVRQESQGSALSEAAARIEQLKARIAELNRLEANYAAKGISGTGDLSKERTALQRELGTLEKGQHAERRQADAAAKNDARERLRHERDINAEVRSREAVLAARMRVVGAIGGAAGGATVAMGGVMMQDYFARQNISLQDSAARASYARNRDLHGTRGFSAGAAISETHGLEDSIFDREQNKPILEDDRKKAMAVGALAGAASGATTGAMIGSMIAPGPGTLIGGGVGALIGAGAGAFGGNLVGKQKIAENDAGQIREKEELAKAEKTKREYVQGEIQPMLDAKKAELNYDMQGKRFAEDKVTAFKTYQSLVAAVGKEAAAEAATDAVRLKQRERGQAMAGLVNARTGTRGQRQIARMAGGLNDPERAGKVFAAALSPVINQAAQPPLHNWMPKTGGQRP